MWLLCLLRRHVTKQKLAHALPTRNPNPTQAKQTQAVPDVACPWPLDVFRVRILNNNSTLHLTVLTQTPNPPNTAHSSRPMCLRPQPSHARSSCAVQVASSRLVQAASSCPVQAASGRPARLVPVWSLHLLRVLIRYQSICSQTPRLRMPPVPSTLKPFRTSAQAVP